MITTETYGCDRHGEEAYQGCALCDLESLRSRLAEADGAIESAVRCLAMCNDGPREALLILNAYKSRNREWRTDSTSEVKP